MIPKSGHRFSEKIMLEQEHDPEQWTPASRLREAFKSSVHPARCFGGRRQVGKDHARTRGWSAMTIRRIVIAL